MSTGPQDRVDDRSPDRAHGEVPDDRSPDRTAHGEVPGADDAEARRAEQAAAAGGRRVLGRRLLIALLLLAVLVLLPIGALFLWLPRIGLSQEEIGDRAWAVLQSEVPAAFLVTGELEVTATTRVENTKTLLPGLIDFDLGTTSAVVRMPGRVIYGIEAAELSRERISVAEDGAIVITLPEPRVYAVEPELSQMEVATRRGWARLSRETEQQVRDRAITLVQATLRAQGTRHIATSTQPHINTARAIAIILRGPLEAAGIEDPVIRFRVGESLTWEDSGLR